MRQLRVKRPVRIVAGAALGAVIGLAYWKLVGCSSGYCPITSNLWLTTGWGAGIGALLASSAGDLSQAETKASDHAGGVK